MSSLAERMKEIQMKEASEVDEAKVAQAVEAKKQAVKATPVENDGTPSLSELMRRMASGESPSGKKPEPKTSSAADSEKEPESAKEFELNHPEEGDEEVEDDDSGSQSANWKWFFGKGRRMADDNRPALIAKPVPKGWTEIECRAIESPLSFARIIENDETGKLLYEAIEPTLSKRETKVLTFVIDTLSRGLDRDPGALSQKQRAEFLTEACRQVIRNYKILITNRSMERILYYVRRDFLGMGDIHVTMLDPEIEDISCDGHQEPLFIFHRKHEAMETNIQFKTAGQLDGFVIRIAQRSGKSISISDPVLDAALPDGSRLQATLGREVTENGSTFTIRRFKPDPFTPVDLLKFGTMDPALLAWFWTIVEFGSSLIFSGGTASGKTTGLNALGQFIPEQAKVVSIEDTRELNLPHKNWIRAVTRGGTGRDGHGEIGMFDLLKASLRQRPEYIIVGEVRGIEASVAFQAMATGHTVYSTMHADSARSVVYRLENEPINIPRLVLQALDVIAIQVQTRYKGKRVRRVKEVVELVGMDPQTRELLTNTVYKWSAEDDTYEYTGRSYLVERIASARGFELAEFQEELVRRAKFLKDLERQGVKGLESFILELRKYQRAAQKREEERRKAKVPA